MLSSVFFVSRYRKQIKIAHSCIPHWWLVFFYKLVKYGELDMLRYAQPNG